MDSNLGLSDEIEVLNVTPSPGTRITKVDKVRLEMRYSLSTQPEAEIHALFGLPDGRAWESGGGVVPVVARGRGEIAFLVTIDPVHLRHYLDAKNADKAVLQLGLRYVNDAGEVWYAVRKQLDEIWYQLDPQPQVDWPPPTFPQGD